MYVLKITLFGTKSILFGSIIEVVQSNFVSTKLWDNVLERREEKKIKLHQPYVTVLEDIVRDDLADLRSMVAKYYCSLLMGIDDAKEFHHMKGDTSLSDKDRRLYETMLCFAVRTVWIALQRRYLGLIGTTIVKKYFIIIH